MTVQAKNKKAGLVLVGVVAGMVGMAYAAVPLYKLFCQVTGFGGTTQRAEAAEGTVLDRPMTIRFTANVNHDMPWNFSPSQLIQETLVGQQMLATYRAHNPTSKRITGTAVFNVTPFKAGEYFNKIECFCFTEQTLEPGESADMPVTYYVDPAIADDPRLDDVKEIVLSYTFYLASSEEVPEMNHEAMAGMAEKEE
jgi:cytochrome c oxidase assembly protein subunit 11